MARYAQLIALWTPWFLVDLDTMSESSSQEDEIAEKMNARMERRRSRDSVCAPEFQQELVDREVIEGDAAQLDVKITGNPEAKVTWYKDGQEVIASTRIHLLSDPESGLYSLLLSPAKAEDEGEFRCMASNMGGSVACQAQLLVEGETSNTSCMVYLRLCSSLSVVTREVLSYEPLRGT